MRWIHQCCTFQDRGNSYLWLYYNACSGKYHQGGWIMRVGRGAEVNKQVQILYAAYQYFVFVYLRFCILICIFICIFICICIYVCICVCTCTSVITMRIMRVGGRRRWTNRGGRRLMLHATQLPACVSVCEATVPCDLWWATPIFILCHVMRPALRSSSPV